MGTKLRNALKAGLCSGAILAGVTASPQKSEVIIQPTDGNTPIVIFLDGINFDATLTTAATIASIKRSLKFRTLPYLIQDLGVKQWGYLWSPNGDPLAGDALTIPWSGDLTNAPGLESYLSVTKALIVNTVKKYPDRPIVIVAHSWGTVIGYQALTELQNTFVSGKRAVDSNAVALFITMGSPLASKSGSTSVRVTKILPSTIPGWEYVDTTRSKFVIRKPDTVGYWANFTVPDDKISSGKLAAADENVTLPDISGTNFIAAHAEYYSVPAAAGVTQMLANEVLNNDCKNVYTINAGTPLANFGVAYNMRSLAGELLVKVTCHGKYLAPTRTEETKPGVKVTIGSDNFEEQVYQTAYVWRNNTWHSVQLNGSNKSASGFFSGPAWADLPFTADEIVPGRTNHVIGYVCEGVLCGCADAFCKTPYWQLQAFKR